MTLVHPNLIILNMIFNAAAAVCIGIPGQWIGTGRLPVAGKLLGSERSCGRDSTAKRRKKGCHRLQKFSGRLFALNFYPDTLFSNQMGLLLFSMHR